jgi:DNA uptake protein ComE-like DNA-binding protein
MPDSVVTRAPVHAVDTEPLVAPASKTKSALYMIWALVPALTLGLASVACFAFAAIRLRSRSLGLCAAGYGLAAIAFLYLTNSGPQKSWQSNLGVVIGLTAAFVATGHAFAIRQRVQDGRVETAEDRAQDRIRQRERCRKLGSQNPQLAAELGVGRPDLDTEYDDGGLVDVNHVPEPYLTSLPGIDAGLAHRIIVLRDSIGGFDSLDDMEVLLDLPPQHLESARDRTVFVR